MPARLSSLLLLLTACAALLMARPAAAGYDRDDVPPMRWDDLLQCPAVVVARYEGYSGIPEDGNQKLRLRVLRSLRGGNNVGQVLHVALAHRYRVERAFFPDDSAADWPAAVPEDAPSLMYRMHPLGRGAIYLDGTQRLGHALHEPAVYFLRQDPAALLEQNRFVLERRGQVRRADEADDWQKVLRDETPSLPFRLLHDLDPERMRAALEELYARRDPSEIDALFARIERGDPHAYRAALTLQAVGDVRGDVYERATRRWESLSRALAAERDVLPEEARRKDPRFAAMHFCGLVRAAVDPARYLADLQGILRESGAAAARRQAWAVQVLSAARAPEALDFLRPLLTHPRLARAAGNALAYSLEDNRTEHLGYRPALPTQRQPAALQKHALPWLPAALESPAFRPPAASSAPRRNSAYRYPLEAALRKWQTAPTHAPMPAGDAAGVSGADGPEQALPTRFDYRRATRLLAARPEEGRLYLERALADRGSYAPAREASLLALAVQTGRADLKDALRDAARRALAEEEAARAGRVAVTPAYSGQIRSAAEWLLVAPEPEDVARYLPVLDTRRALHFTDHNIASLPTNAMRMSDEYLHLLARLFDATPGPFFERVLYLLESPLFAERAAGVEALRRTIYTDLDFDHTAFAEEREARLAKIRPLLARLSRQADGPGVRRALRAERDAAVKKGGG